MSSRVVAVVSYVKSVPLVAGPKFRGGFRNVCEGLGMELVQQFRALMSEVEPHMLTAEDRVALLHLVEQSASSAAHSAA